MLARAGNERCFPRIIRLHQGSEFDPADLDLRTCRQDVTHDILRPGKPTENAFLEAFFPTLCQECLSAHWSLTLADAGWRMEAWRRYYNEDRPHGAIGYKTPIALMNPDGTAGQPSR